MSAALSSVVLERLFDILLVITCFLLVSVAYRVPDGLRRGAWVLAALAVVGFLILLIVQRRRQAAEVLVDRLMVYLPAAVRTRLRPVVGHFLDGLGGLADGGTVVVVLGYSAYIWGVITLTFLFAFLAAGITVPLAAASLATVVIVAAFVFLPQAPGFVGTWQAGCVLALGLFGVPRDAAVGYSVLTWLIQMVTTLTVAGFFLAREGLSPARLLRTTAGDT